MDANEYQERALSFLSPAVIGNELQRVNAALGLAGEAGEVADLVKKEIFHGHGQEHGKLIEEAGDIAWYLALLCASLGTSLAYVMRRNLLKLEARYPNGFETERSINRREVVS